jgi:hypothetical protein
MGVAWRKLKALKGYVMSRIGPLLSGNNHVTESAAKAALLAEAFAAVGQAGGRNHQIDSLEIEAAFERGNEEYNCDITLKELHNALQASKKLLPVNTK